MNRQWRQRTVVSLVSAALLFSTVSCGTRSETPGEESQPGSDAGSWDLYKEAYYDSPEAGEPRKGGVVTYADMTEPRILDPAMMPSAAQAGATVLVAIHDQLVRYDVESGEYEPRVAESVVPNDDATEWVVTLREGVTFSDGTPLDADAVVFSVERYLRLRTGDDGSVIKANLDSVEKVDALTVKFVLKNPWPMFKAELAKGLGMIVHPKSSDDPQSYRPIGVGAFTLGEYRPQERLTLEANDKYWDGRPYLDGMRFVWLGDPETIVSAFEKGDVDAFMLQDPIQFEKLRENNTPGFVQISGLGLVVLINGADDRPGSNEKVRRALAHAIDEQDLKNRANGDAGVASKRLFSPASKWYDEDIDATPHDPQKAREYLEEAKGEGFDGSIELVSLSAPSMRSEALALKAQLESVGFSVEQTELRSTADLINTVYVDKNFDISRSGLSISDNNPYAQLYGKFHSQSPSRSMPADPEMDKLLNELRDTPMEDAGEILGKIEARFQETSSAIALAPRPSYVGWHEKIQGVTPTNDALSGWEKAWIAE
ncbi:ABC transporter substrate-binding protein [Enemella sp. A6]|uniref:ABC transporter substrate-binding protein n=1 Tax=Enemella sp. A6 TaxID=3440152 RepID=UPI003EB8316E